MKNNLSAKKESLDLIAKLKELGYPVLRVKHNCGESDVNIEIVKKTVLLQISFDKNLFFYRIYDKFGSTIGKVIGSVEENLDIIDKLISENK